MLQFVLEPGVRLLQLLALISRNRHLSLYSINQLFSMVGSFAQGVGYSWLVYRMTNSGFLLGVITTCVQLPAFIISPFAGAYLDSHDRRKILIVAQLLNSVQAWLLFVLCFSQQITLSWIVTCSVLAGLANGIEMAARHALLSDVAKNEDLSDAIVLNSLIFQLSRAVGSSLAGVFLARQNEAYCFFLNGLLSSLAVLSLLKLQLSDSPSRMKVFSGSWERIKLSVQYVKNAPMIRSILILSFLLSLFSFPYFVILPVFVREGLGGDGALLASLMSKVGWGALLGLAILKVESKYDRTLRFMAIEISLLGLLFLVFALSNDTSVAQMAIFIVGFLLFRNFPRFNMVIQQFVEPGLRGRVIGLYSAGILGATPAASFLGGMSVEWIGYRSTLVVMGSCCILLAIYVVNSSSIDESWPIIPAKG